MKDHELRKLLRSIDPEQIELPDGLAERVWSDVEKAKDAHLETENSLDSHNQGEERDLPAAVSEDAPLLADIEPLPATTAVPAQRKGLWLVAAAMIAIVIIGVTQRTNEPQTELATEAPEQAVADEGDGDAVGPTSNPADADFLSPLTVTATERTSLAFEFTAANNAVFNATLWQAGSLVATTGGSAVAGEAQSVLFEDLADSTLYEVEVILLGPPTIRSGVIEAQTAGETPLLIRELAITSNGADELVTFTTNLCSQVSYVILDAETRDELSRLQTSIDDECSTTHEFSTEQVSSADEVLVVVEAEAIEQGELTGNRSTETVTVRRQDN